MDKDMKRPFEFCFNVLKFYGLWIDGEEKRSYRIYGITLIIFCQIGFVISMFSGVLQRGITLETVETISFGITGVSGLLRILDFLAKIKLIKYLYTSINVITIKHVKNDNFIRKRVKTFFMIHISQGILAITSIVSGDFVSIQSKTLPYTIGVPFDTENNEIGFWAAYSYLFITLKYVAPIYPCLGALPVFFMNFAIGLMEDFNERLKNFGLVVGSESGGSVENEVMENEIKEIVETHEVIKNFVKQISEIFRLTFFIKSIVGSIILCTSLFVIPLVSNNYLSNV
jgi:hypothetical protein